MSRSYNNYNSKTLCGDGSNNLFGINRLISTYSELESGGTVLGSHSNQQFITVARIKEYDESNITEINTRLVGIKEKKYELLDNYMKKTSNNVPQRIEDISRMDGGISENAEGHAVY